MVRISSMAVPERREGEKKIEQTGAKPRQIGVQRVKNRNVLSVLVKGYVGD